MRHSKSCLMAGSIALLAGASLPAAAQESIGKDLKATIALQGQSCDAVVKSQRNGDSDYTVTCKDGNRYHVFIDPQGRVVVKKLSP
jgi:hypothetical protein